MKTARQPKPITIVIVDDHRMFREQLASLINQSADMKVCAEAENARQGFELISAIRPSIAIVDISLKDSSGLELVKQLRAQAIDVPVPARVRDLVADGALGRKAGRGFHRYE